MTTYTVQIIISPGPSSNPYNISITVNAGCLINNQQISIPSSGANQQCFQTGNLIFQYLKNTNNVSLSSCALANTNSTTNYNPSSLVTTNNYYNGPVLLFELDIGMTPCFILGSITNNSNFCSYIRNNEFSTCSTNPNLTVNITVVNQFNANQNTQGFAIGLGGKSGGSGTMRYNLTYQNSSGLTQMPIQGSSGYIYVVYPNMAYNGNNNQWNAVSSNSTTTLQTLTICKYSGNTSNTVPNGQYAQTPSMNSDNLFTQTAGTIFNSCSLYQRISSNYIPSAATIYQFMPCGTIFNQNNTNTGYFSSAVTASGGLFPSTVECAITNANISTCNNICLANCAVINNPNFVG